MVWLVLMKEDKSKKKKKLTEEEKKEIEKRLAKHKKYFESNTLFVFLRKSKYVNYNLSVSTYLQFSNKILSFLINKLDAYKRDKIAKILPFSCEIAYIVMPDKVDGSGIVVHSPRIGNVFKSHGDRELL